MNITQVITPEKSLDGKCYQVVLSFLLCVNHDLFKNVDYAEEDVALIKQ